MPGSSFAIAGEGAPSRPPPPGTALGALHRHLTGEAHPPEYVYQPTNVVFALFPPLEGRHRGKAARKEAYVARAREDDLPGLDLDRFRAFFDQACPGEVTGPLTVALHDRFYCFRKNKLVEVRKVEARGMVQ